MARAVDPMKKVIKATLALAAENGWRDLTLEEIAAKSKVPLKDLRGLVRDKAQILERFAADIDAEVLGSLEPELADEVPRDRLFDVLMRRFEILAPHKDALRRIAADLKSSPVDHLALAGSGMRSMQWMMAGAGVETPGLKGLVQINALGCLYMSVFRTWLDDDDPGLARTMAALDQGLRRGETWLKNAQVPLGLGQALAQFVCSYRRARKQRGTGETEPAPTA